MTPFQLEPEVSRELAVKFGTPLYLIDETSFRGRIRAYRAAWESRYPAMRISYASKANSTLALLQIAHQEGLHLDVASLGEMLAARRAGIPAAILTVHGNNKSREFLAQATEERVGEIVVDSVEEAHRLHGVTGIPFVARVNPRVEAAAKGTNAKIATGHGGSKFGMELADLQRVAEVLPIEGLHAHLGSNFVSSAPQREAAAVLIDVADQLGIIPELINLGGGLGIRYPGVQPPSFDTHAEAVLGEFAPRIAARGWKTALGQEPGRALIGECGVTLYTVGSTKTIGETIFVAVDGGLFENPRPALYDAVYEVLGDRGGDGDEVRVTVVGSHCENDVLFREIRLPRLPRPGDVLQVLCTGAYHSGMASNYNRFVRPPSVLRREDGSFVLIQRRETYEELFARESLF